MLFIKLQRLIGPTRSRLYNTLAGIMTLRGSYLHLRIELRLKMADTELLGAARSALQAGQRQEARTLLMQFVRQQPDNSEAWHLLAQALDDPRQKAECEARARALLVWSMAATPGFEQALAEFQARNLPPREATDLLAEFLHQHPQHPFAAGLRAYLEEVYTATRNLPPREATALLAEFLHQHPRHPFAPVLQAYLEDMRVLVTLREPKQEAPRPVPKPRPPVLLGEYLIERGMVTREQVERALAEQEWMRQLGIEHRLGTLLLQHGQLQPKQLAAALTALLRPGLVPFGSYLVQRGILTTEQVGRALARQATIAAELERGSAEALAAYERERSRKTHRTLLGRVIPPTGKPSRKAAPKLGEVLVSMGMLTSEQVETLLQEWQHERIHGPASDRE